jgi:Fe-S cluster assembly protein SufD
MSAIPANPPAKRADPYLKAFERLEQAGAHRQPTWLFPLRKAGMARFAELGFPTLKHEDWRFTNVAPIAKLPFKPVLEAEPNLPSREALHQFPLANLAGSRFVFIDGIYSRELSDDRPLPDGVKLGSLAEALAAVPSLVEKHLGRYARTEDNTFAALNTAFFQDGGFVFVPAGRVLPEPVHFLFVNTGKESGAAIHPRNLIIVEPDAKATVIESYVSLGDATAATLTNAVTEFSLGDRAVVEHCKLQDESLGAFHIAALHSRVGRAVSFSSHSVAIGAKLSRNNIRTTLDGEGIETVLNGVYLTGGEQLADHHMVVDHAKPHCASHEYFNGILAGRSRGIFHGRILVRPDAQKTDAKQTNKNLLLSDDASADAKPQLEIYADDVKCTHGATVGQLNEESIYYLRSRGIGLETARRMLIHAFAGEIIDRVKHDGLREELDAVVWDRLEQQESVAVGK